ncbi:unnamed protein product [Clonostachys rhizophaga]|uniref:Uncharacterized protein n=1 Tax=Clonostachys rhizophaga TaxID=160324 RepID=A0A9N9VV50_9HYPO|nr:unnamed protein product [Clonostachys rhizophaga]
MSKAAIDAVTRKIVTQLFRMMGLEPSKYTQAFEESSNTLKTPKDDVVLVVDLDKFLTNKDDGLHNGAHPATT